MRRHPELRQSWRTKSPTANGTASVGGRGGRRLPRRTTAPKGGRGGRRHPQRAPSADDTDGGLTAADGGFRGGWDGALCCCWSPRRHHPRRWWTDHLSAAAAAAAAPVAPHCRPHSSVVDGPPGRQATEESCAFRVEGWEWAPHRPWRRNAQLLCLRGVMVGSRCRRRTTATANGCWRTVSQSPQRREKAAVSGWGGFRRVERRRQRQKA